VGTLSPRRRQAEQTKERIVEVALHLFAEQGYTATSTRQIAHTAGVSEGLIFHYFPTKMDLLLAIPSHGHRFTPVRFMGSTCDSDQPVAAAIHAIALRFVDLAREEADFLNMLVGESRSNDELYDLFRFLMDQATGALAAYIDVRVADGELRPDLPTTSAAASLIGSLVGFLLGSKHLDDTAWSEASRQYTRDVAELWLRGALASSTSRRSPG
jgi:AcrR family transcriptional regulator